MSFIPGRLDGDEIKKEILCSLSGKFQLKDNEINEVLRKFWQQDAYNSLISYPEYLKLLISFLKKIKRSDFNRSDFLSFAMRTVVKDESLHQKLMEFALVMESLQINEAEPKLILETLSKLGIAKPKELISLLKKLSVFEEKTIDKKQLIGFKHHSIQEYLAANFILFKKNPIKIIEKLVIIKQDNLVSIKPSWYGVIRFLLESKLCLALINLLISLGKKNPKVIDESYSDAITSVYPNKITTKIQIEIFDLVYQTYQRRAVWLPLWTRHNLAKFCKVEHLRQFRYDIKSTSNKTETFVHKGNVADIIRILLQENNAIITNEEKQFWKPVLVAFANDSNENGVLQRHALDALSTFKDPTLIPKVIKSLAHPEKLVREAFVQFCYETDPNNELTIKYLVEGIKSGIDIYGRHGIYEVDNKFGIKELLSYFAKDESFLERFLDRESIFNKDDKKGDQILIVHIKKNVDEAIIKLIKDVIKTAYQAGHIYHQERSYFLEQLIEICTLQNNNYIFEVIKDIEVSDKNRWHLLCNYESLFAQVIQPKHLSKFFEEIKKLDEGKSRVAELVIYKAKYLRKADGENIYKEAVKLGLIEPLREQPKEISSAQSEKIYKEFTNLLEPAEGKYFPTVFEFFNRNQKELEPFLTAANKKRLAKLVLDEGLNKIDPNKIEVKINWDSSGKQFSISTVSSYYGDLLTTAQKLLPSEIINKYRQNIINFIPYSFSDDQQIILELVEPIRDSELEEVNNKYLNKKNDARYLIPSSYIYLIKRHLDNNVQLKSAISVLKSFITDEKISTEDKDYALHQIGGLISETNTEMKRFLGDIFNRYKADSKNEKLAITANKIQIDVYKEKDAINWRFNQLKERLTSFKEPEMGIAHWVGPIEEELDSKWFARPLINLNSDIYISNFLELLDFSFKNIPYADEKDYWSYIKYLWAVVIAYFDKLKQNGSFEPLKKLEAWLEKNAKDDGLNWLKAQARELYTSYELHFGKAKNISDAISIIEKIKKDEQ